MNTEDAYLFRHAVLRDAAYQLQLPADRALLHAFAFSILEALQGALVQGTEAALEMAEHASRGAIHDPALAQSEKHWLGKAAALAEQHSAHDTAAAIWLRLRALATHTPIEAIAATLNAGGNLLQAGHYKEAENLLSEINKNAMARVEDRFKAAQHLSAIKISQQRFREAREDIAQLRSNHSALIDPIMDLKLLVNEVLTGKEGGTMSREQLALEGIAKARALGQPQLLRTLRVNLSNIYRLSGRARESLPILQEEFDAALQRGENSWTVKIGVNLAWTHLALDNVKAARACAKQIAPSVPDAGLSARHAYKYLLSIVAENEGRSEEAHEHLVESLDLVLELGQLRDAANTLHSLALHSLKAGHHAEVARRLQQLKELAIATQDLKVFERYEAAHSLELSRRGDHMQAYEACQRALGYARKIHDARVESLHLGNAGLHATVLGRPEAKTTLLEASRLSNALGETYQLAWWELGLAIVAALEGGPAGERLSRLVQLLRSKFPPEKLKHESASLHEQIARTSKVRGINLDVLSEELARLFAAGGSTPGAA